MKSTTGPLARARTWAVSALLAASVGTAALGYHLADSASQTVAAGTSSTSSTSSGTTSSTSSSSSSSFGSTTAPGSSSGPAAGGHERVMSDVATMTPSPPAGASATGSSTFSAIGTTNRLLTTDPGVIADAVLVAQDHLAELDAAASRFREDSEVSRLAARAAHGPAWAFASPVLAAYLRAGLRAAELTDGLVDPTVGAAVVASGYDADMDLVRARGGRVGDAAPAPIPGWRSVTLEDATDRVSVPQGCLLDLGASAKGQAADTIARLLAERLPGGFLVSLGGDIAVSGEIPEGGWRVGVEDADGHVVQVVTSTGQAIATSSTRLRTWAADDGVRHHIVDPRTGRTAPAVWAQVTCAGASALEANAASTAAVVLGAEAPAWLAARGIPARLDGVDGTVHLVAGWPEPADAPGVARPDRHRGGPVMTNELLWYLSRATGIVSIVLMTSVVVLGMVVSGRRRPAGDGSTVVMATHRWLSLGMVVFLFTHVATAIAETYVSIDLISALVPFSSAYQPFFVGLGTLAVDILVAVLATSLLRHRLSPRAWKAVHWLSYLMWPFALVHGFVLGTANEPVLRAITAVCGVVGAAVVGWRLTTTHHDRDRRRHIAAQEWT